MSKKIFKLTGRIISGGQGFSLVELMVVVTISGLIFIAVSNFYVRGMQMNEKTFQQTSAQDTAVKIMHEISEGFRDNNGQKIGGLRSAREVNTDNQGLAYNHADAPVVSYYLEGQTLYRNVDPYENSPIIINVTGGTPIAENVSEFAVEKGEDGSNILVLIKLTLKTGDDPRINGSVSLQTRIMPRNIIGNEEEN